MNTTVNRGWGTVAGFCEHGSERQVTHETRRLLLCWIMPRDCMKFVQSTSPAADIFVFVINASRKVYKIPKKALGDVPDQLRFPTVHSLVTKMPPIWNIELRNFFRMRYERKRAVCMSMYSERPLIFIKKFAAVLRIFSR